MGASNLGTTFTTRVSATVDESSKRTVADRHILAAYHQALLTGFSRVPTSMTLNDLESSK